MIDWNRDYYSNYGHSLFNTWLNSSSLNSNKWTGSDWANFGGPAASGFFGLLGSIFGNVAQKKMNDANNALNIQLHNQANAMQVSESEKAYQRSTAQNQVNNYMSAGMSRAGALNALNGAGSYTPAPISVATTNAGQVDTSGMIDSLGMISNAYSNAMQMKETKRQFDANLAETKRVNDETIAGIKIQNDLQAQSLFDSQYGSFVSDAISEALNKGCDTANDVETFINGKYKDSPEYRSMMRNESLRNCYYSRLSDIDKNHIAHGNLDNETALTNAQVDKIFADAENTKVKTEQDRETLRQLRQMVNEFMDPRAIEARSKDIDVHLLESSMAHNEKADEAFTVQGLTISGSIDMINDAKEKYKNASTTGEKFDAAGQLVTGYILTAINSVEWGVTTAMDYLEKLPLFRLFGKKGLVGALKK